MTHRADAIYKKTTGQFLVGVQLLVNCAQLTCVHYKRTGTLIYQTARVLSVVFETSFS